MTAKRGGKWRRRKSNAVWGRWSSAAVAASCVVGASADGLQQIIPGQQLIKHVSNCSCWRELSPLPSAEQIQLNKEGWEDWSRDDALCKIQWASSPKYFDSLCGADWLLDLGSSPRFIWRSPLSSGFLLKVRWLCEISLNTTGRRFWLWVKFCRGVTE